MKYITINFLTEALDAVDATEPLTSWLFHNAKPYFREIGAGDDPSMWYYDIQERPSLLYRGVRYSYANRDAGYVLVKPHEERRAYGMSSSSASKWNQAMASQGCVALRSNSLFATGSMKNAEFFGQLAVVIPGGEFDYSWSPQVGDANHTGVMWANTVGASARLKYECQDLRRAVQDADKAEREMSRRIWDLEEQPGSGDEVVELRSQLAKLAVQEREARDALIACDGRIRAELRDELISKVTFKTTDLQQAISGKADDGYFHEVMIKPRGGHIAIINPTALTRALAELAGVNHTPPPDEDDEPINTDGWEPDDSGRSPWD